MPNQFAADGTHNWYVIVTLKNFADPVVQVISIDWVTVAMRLGLGYANVIAENEFNIISQPFQRNTPSGGTT
ncbi:hypothetical protein A1354_12345 [Pseudomonas asplenii]|nr:hypothetical protein A1354_12345 [Pseudomonas asplenii]